MASLKDKVAIVTGASSGIGAGIARYFATLGARLLLTGRNVENLQKVASECEELGLAKEKIHQVIADLATDEGVKSVCSEAVAYFGRIDVLINNAGITNMALIEHQDMDRYDDIMSINVGGPYRMIHLTIPELRKTKGNIVNISSTGGFRAVMMHSVYCSSKAALDHITRCAAIELGKDGIRVNAINPGYVPSELLKRNGMTQQKYDELGENCVKAQAIYRHGTLEDVAKAVAFVASDDAAHITGATIPVDGGMGVMPFKAEELFH